MSTENSTVAVSRHYYCRCRNMLVGKDDLRDGPMTCQTCGTRFWLGGTGGNAMNTITMDWPEGEQS